MDTDGTQFVPWDELLPNDVIVVPAFGTTVEIERLLLSKGILIEKYNTTCPFVEKVWNRSKSLSEGGFTTIIHGKPRHEETRATFSHSAREGHAIVIKDMHEAKLLGRYISGDEDEAAFLKDFNGRFTEGFRVTEHFVRVGVVNQTTMLASETQAIADFFKQLMVERYGPQNLSWHFADTKDTLCYATNDNQDSTYELLNTEADLAIVVGGYNSSNTSHIVELCEQKFPTYFINSANEIASREIIQHFDVGEKRLKQTRDFLSNALPLKIILTSGASCPDTLVDEVMLKLVGYHAGARTIAEVLEEIAL
jgi:4-hydroxy-3-methylbut-2-enyl diphosphate reductase